jgi:hypothetical protein
MTRPITDRQQSSRQNELILLGVKAYHCRCRYLRAHRAAVSMSFASHDEFGRSYRRPINRPGLMSAVAMTSGG